ncbi:hypothetical protein [Hyphomicrobium sp. NDB2Meth4]|uniref:hypothetical protein n=1 Tax=Hyphomicrobium sp. NDB2Meth4 TaxID=1892846 RepID=UPI000A75427F|nr:hypothetical protein [Hyphomicrobium sp. NDB2Meth4]
MKSSLQAALLAAMAAAAVSMGAVAAHAGDFEDLMAAQEVAAVLDELTGSDSAVSDVVTSAASDAAADALIGAIEDAAEE